MANLGDVVKLTKSQYESLINGETVKGQTYNENNLYLVEEEAEEPVVLLWQNTNIHNYIEETTVSLNDDISKYKYIIIKWTPESDETTNYSIEYEIVENVYYGATTISSGKVVTNLNFSRVDATLSQGQYIPYTVIKNRTIARVQNSNTSLKINANTSTRLDYGTEGSSGSISITTGLTLSCLPLAIYGTNKEIIF